MARILVVDDDVDIAELVALRMSLDGHEVHTVHDGTSGLQRALADRPDVVIVDWTLPGLTGPEICSRLRAEHGADSSYLIMLTARHLAAGEADSSGADELLAKPFSPRTLSQTVSAALAARSSRGSAADR